MHAAALDEVATAAVAHLEISVAEAQEEVATAKKEATLARQQAATAVARARAIAVTPAKPRGAAPTSRSAMYGADLMIVATVSPTADASVGLAASASPSAPCKSNA